jgi:hypothetical protein
MAAYLQQDFDAANAATAELLLGLAEGLVIDYLGVRDTYPAVARAVILEAAARGYRNPQGLATEATGPYSASYRPPGGVYLTKDERRTLRQAGRGGAFSIDPTPVDAGTTLAPWDQNVWWPSGVVPEVWGS